jgi:gamma-glutamyltranspeptidase/glutathione hydrolase
VTDAGARAELCAQARFGPKAPVRGRGGMVISSHPLVTRTGIDTLRDGGNACDAALAAAMMQTVVEPHMTTITGMLTLLYRDAATARVSVVNGGVNAPLAPLPAFQAADVRTGRGVAVPGFWGAFEAAADRLGTQSIPRLMAPAIRTAREGFEIQPFLYGDMYGAVDRLGRSADAREMYFDARRLRDPGEPLVQSRAADTLERLGQEGSEYFYRGEFADHFSSVVAAAGGLITRADFEAYQPRWLEPITGTYRGHQVITTLPPDTGGLHLVEAFNMIELLDLQRLGHPTESPDTLEMLMRIAEAVKSDGARLNDPTTHHLPLETLASKDYAAHRLELLKGQAIRTEPTAPPGSNHVTVVDSAGNIASVLHSCLCNFGENGLFVDGISICAAGGHFLRTMPLPGSRASVFIAPNIILKDGRPVLTSGSPSMCLLTNILQNSINVLDFGMTLEDSIPLPRFGHWYEEGQLVEADFPAATRAAVEARGIRLQLVSPWHYLMGSFEGVAIDPDGGLVGMADPRRTGAAEAVSPGD